MALDLWIGAEIEEVVAEDFRQLSKQLESKINEKLAALSLPQGDKWTFIATILSPATAKFYPDRSKFAKSRRTFEANVNIGYHHYINANTFERVDLIAKAILQSMGPMMRAKVEEEKLLKIESAVLISAEELKASISRKH